MSCSRTSLLAGTLTVALCAIVPASAAALDIGPSTFRTHEAPTHQILAALDFNPSPGLGLGYGQVRRLAIGGLARNVLLAGAVRVPVFLIPKLDTASMRVGAAAFVLEGPWNVRMALGLGAQAFDNQVASGQSYAYEAALVPGYFAERWHVGLGVQFQHAPISRFVHTAAYKANMPEVKDGLYASTSMALRAGLVGGYRFGESVEIHAAAGMRVAGDLGSYDPYLFPWFFVLGCAWGL
jgi:hypothetical protein